jgi:hypothetical protein
VDPSETGAHFFVNYFPPEVIFRGKFRGFLGKTILQNFFRGKIQFFPTFSGEKI